MSMADVALEFCDKVQEDVKPIARFTEVKPVLFKKVILVSVNVSLGQVNVIRLVSAL